MADDRRSTLSVGELALLEPLLRERQPVRFSFQSTARRRLDRLAVTLETTLGVLRADLSAAALGISALEGGADLPLELGHELMCRTSAPSGRSSPALSGGPSAQPARPRVGPSSSQSVQS